MAKILDFEQAALVARSKKWVERVIEGLGDMYGDANQNVEEYAALLRRDVRSGIAELPSFIAEARSINKIPDSMVGGPNTDWTVPLLNIVGNVYPELERDTRREALKHIMNYLDGLNYVYSQNHIEGIDEPWLAADVVITRPLYWPGFSQYTELLEKHRTWKEVQAHMKTIRSAFWMAMAVVRREFASDEVRRNFYQHFPTLIDRTQDGIAGLISDHAESESIKEGTEFKHNVEKRLFKYDANLVSELLGKIKERKWIALPDRSQFNYKMQDYERQNPIDKVALTAELRSMRRRYDQMDELLISYQKHCDNATIKAAIQEILQD